MKIVGYEYEIKCELPFSVLGAMGKVDSGVCQMNIANDLCVQQKISTLIHEIIEIINAAGDLGLTHPQICALEVGLFQTLNEAEMDFAHLFSFIEGTKKPGKGK